MNKDLDDRLIPNGEYRDAQNISVGKSEADDIGALETVLGNVLGNDFNSNIVSLEIIGYYSDEINNRLIVFLTDYNDTNDNPTPPSSTNNCYIYEYTPANKGIDLLVSGIFLNFSKNKPITGVDLIEDLLFFTDNRNQPRKINVTTAKADSNYYKTETDISVAKYNPYEGISLLDKVSKNTTTTSGSTTTLTFANTTDIVKGMSVVEYGNTDLQPEDYVHVVSFTGTVVTLSKAVGNITSGDTIYFFSTTMAGEDITLDFNGGAAWPGDPNFLEDKFVRFSYRFKFDDGEYSIMAPFTQIGFIPKQKGYFLEGQENSAFRSTILEFMENGVQDIKLKIPLPDVQNNIGVDVNSTYKIAAIDVLYKESDGLAVKVLDTIESIGVSTTSNEYIYEYQSRKPFKTLPQDQTVRVYDKVPVKALGQAVSGNRVIYGNFLDKYTSPQFLNYRVGVSKKNTAALGFDNWAEYPNHSLKQNRNYQVGFILADKYGRQSDVILSSVDTTIENIGGVIYGGSTVYAPYHANNTSPSVKDWFGDALTLVLNSGIESGNNGNPSTSDITNGQPGLYGNPIANGFNIAGVTPTINTAMTIPVLGGAGFRYQFTLNGGVATGVPVVGSFLRGKYTDYVDVVEVGIAGAVYSVFTRKPINDSFYSLTVPATTPDNQFAYTINPEGWYSYKIVVKQTQQDYYNVYLPGILAGYPGQPLPTSTQENLSSNNFYLNLGAGATKSNDLIQVGMVVTSDDPTEVIDNPTIVTKKNANEFTFSTTQSIGVDELIFYRVPGDLSLFPADEIGKTANIVLINDNINKVPRDLAEVGPDQKQFRSSVQLFGRVSNSGFNFNDQYFPGTTTDTAVSISTANDSNFKLNTILDQNYQSIYQFDTNPLIARLEVQAQTTTFAVSNNSPAAGVAVNLTIAAAPTIPVEVGMIITNNGVDTSGAVIGTVYGVVTAIISTTSFTCRLSVGPNGNPALKFTSTIGSPNGRSRLEDFTLMEPTLAIYETEPVESLLDIFWETNTVGLIADLNKDVSSGFDGTVGWSSHTWTQSENLAAQTVIITGLFPLNASGGNLTNTSISNFTATNANGTSVPIILEKDLSAGNGSYRVRLNDTFVFLNDATLRNFTLQATITNLAVTPGVPAIISLSGSLSNAAPVFTTSNQTVSQTFTGAVVTLTGINGSARTSSNTQQLRWTKVSGDNNNYFSINENTGVLSKDNNNTPAATYSLGIKLEDTWNGSSVANPGALSVTVNQQVVVNSSVVGFAFSASAVGVFNSVCNINGSISPSCGTVTYYNRTTNSGTPLVNDVIAQGPNQNSAFAAAGYYSFNCAQTGLNNRRYYKVGANGVVTNVDQC